MKVLSHRGFWLNPGEKNTVEAFERSFKLGFGTETDVRDLNGELVISHDPARNGAMPLQQFLGIYGDCGLPLAMNIKADGLAEPLKKAMQAAGVTNWFVFDMSVPDMRHHLAAGNAVYARLSEVEQSIPWEAQIQGIWLDGFSGEWYDAAAIRAQLEQSRPVCVVSPELHGRPHQALWTMLAELKHYPHLSLCTDLPTDAQTFFGTQQ